MFCSRTVVLDLSVAKIHLSKPGAWNAIVTKYVSVQSLSLQKCYSLTNEMLADLCNNPNFQNLVSLNLESCIKITSAGMQPIINAPFASNLLSLDIKACSKLTELTWLSHLPSLTYLNLSELKLNLDATTIAPKLINLQTIKMEKCSGVGDVEVIPFLQHCLKLEIVLLSETDVTFNKTELTRFPKLSLKHIDISWCRKISDSSLYFIAKKCPLLEVLNLECCYDITDGGIIKCINNCTEIIKLNLSDCFRLTDRILAELANCKKLRHFGIKGSSFTKAALDVLQAALPNCNF